MGIVWVLFFADYIAFVVEKILLCDTGVRAEIFGGKSFVEILFRNATDPDINGKRVIFAESEEQGAERDLGTDTLDRAELFHTAFRVTVKRIQIKASVTYSCRRVRYVFGAEARVEIEDRALARLV